jgi:hypothetical protein
MQGLVADLLRKQRALADALGSFQGKSEELASCLKHADPKVRTLALGAIFMREDAHDLPLIASLLGDISPTFDDIENVPDRFGPPAKADYAHPQSVGDVARAMISYYLDSGGAQVQNSQTELEGEETTSGLPGAFKRYWKARKDRRSCASWLLVKLQRATQEQTPLPAECAQDVARVRAEIDALSSVDRGWTLLFIRSMDQINRPLDLWPEPEFIEALKAVGPHAFMEFLLGMRATDDPDLLPDAVPAHTMGIILNHARDLLRPEDAGFLISEASGGRLRGRVAASQLLGAAAELIGTRDEKKAADLLKSSLDRFPLVAGSKGWQEQMTLMVSLWHIRGAAEKDFLTNWFYMMAVSDSNDGQDYQSSFLWMVSLNLRPDTAELLTSLVSDSRFDHADWMVLKQMIDIINASRKTPIISRTVVLLHNPNLHRPDQDQTLADWRDFIRINYGVMKPR